MYGHNALDLGLPLIPEHKRIDTIHVVNYFEKDAPVAQWIERNTPDVEVGGSNPLGRAKKHPRY